MANSDFSISITNDAVDIRYTPSVSEPHGKFVGFVSISGILIASAALMLLLPDKQGEPSMWHDLTNASFGSPSVWGAAMLILFLSLFGWLGFRYARAAWASDEIIHCDREAITIKRVPWLDFSNHTWRTYTYPLSDVRAIRFAVIASAKGRSFWGLRFRSHGRRWMLPGLEAPEAEKILAGLKALGADVRDDPKLAKRVKEVLSIRVYADGANWIDNSLTDSSWMDQKKR